MRRRNYGSWRRLVSMIMAGANGETVAAKRAEHALAATC
jgi:hypothetical protein